MVQDRTYECTRCGTEFPLDDVHTEIVRRDFVDVPQPSRIDRLCRDCLEAYIGDFLGGEFATVLQGYRTSE